MFRAIDPDFFRARADQITGKVRQRQGQISELTEASGYLSLLRYL